MKTIPLTQGKVAIVDDEDYERLIAMGSWCYDGHGYAVKQRYFLDGKFGHLQMHRIVNNTPEGMMTDHINGNRLDNRRSNLRSVDGVGNALNKRGHRESTYRGCSKTREGKYVVRFRSKRIGVFEDEGLAYQIYTMLLSGELPPEPILTRQGWERKHGKYQVRIKLNGQRYSLGVFDSPDEATHVYNAVKEQLA